MATLFHDRCCVEINIHVYTWDSVIRENGDVPVHLIVSHMALNDVETCKVYYALCIDTHWLVAHMALNDVEMCKVYYALCIDTHWRRIHLDRWQRGYLSPGP
jgi:hypothetical protein